MKSIFPKKVMVLGDSWEIRVSKADDDSELSERSLGGYCYTMKNLIVIRDFREELPDEPEVAVRYMKEALRHELIHSFMKSSGIWENSHGSDAIGTDEMITDWFAIQSPKIFKVFQECNAL